MDEFIQTHGSYLAILLVLALTGAGLPIPEEVVIVAAGVSSSPSVARLNPWFAWVACLVGAQIGDCVMYGIGRGLGRTYIRRHRWFTWLFHADREARMERLVRQHRVKVFLLARFLVGLRSPIYLAMGVLRVDFRRFLLWDTACGALVISVFFLLSYFFGGWIAVLIRQSQFAVTGTVLIVAALAGGYYFIWKKCLQRLDLDD